MSIAIKYFKVRISMVDSCNTIHAVRFKSHPQRIQRIIIDEHLITPDRMNILDEVIVPHRISGAEIYDIETILSLES